MNWQPIETAPKDGTDILVKSEEGVYQARWLKFDLERLCYFEALRLSEHGCGCCGDDSAKPTHWMPIPKE